MRRRLADWLGYVGVLALVAAFVLPLARAQWNAARPWVFVAGTVLIVASILLRLDYGRRVTRYGLNSALLVILVIGVIAFVEAISYRHNARLDLTENRRHSLSAQTIQLLKNLTSDVAATAFYRSDQPGKKVAEDLLKQYASYSGGKFTWTMRDLDREPVLARRYGVDAYGAIVLETKNGSEKVSDAEEEKLTNGLVKVTRQGKRVVYVVKGHGELELESTDRQGFSEAKAAMERSNYDVKELVLARESAVPDDAAVVILAGPRTDPFKPELDALDAYLDKGGKLFVLADPFQSAGFGTWLAKHGFELRDDFVVELNPIGQIFGYGPIVPLIVQYGMHTITRDMREATVFPLTRSIKPGAPGGKLDIHPLALTSPQSWGETDKAALEKGSLKRHPQDTEGPLTVAAASAVDKSRIVVYGTSSLAANQFLNVQGNRDLFLNTVSWLAGQEDLISIRPKDTKQTPVMLTSQQHQFVFLVPVVLLPAVALIAGVVVFARRRAAR